MKIKGDLFNRLETMVKASCVFGNLSKYRDLGLSDRRYRWDCLYSISFHERKEWFDEVYKFANDDHIDTALRKITETI